MSKGANRGLLPLLCTRRQFCGCQKNAVVGRIMFPKDVHDLTLGTSEYIIDMTLRDFADAVKVKDLKMWRLSWIVWVSQSNHTSP